MVFAVFLSACEPGAQYTLPPGVTLVPGTDISQQVATFVSNTLTQTAVVIPATATPAFGPTPGTGDVSTSVPGGTIPPTPTPSLNQTLYQSPAFGIQFSYPSTWYRSETDGSLTLTSFDPVNPPHKLEWTNQTVSIQFGYKVFIMPPASFDAWVEEAKQTAPANGLSIFAAERFQLWFANQPAAHLTLVSGSGGIIHQVLTNLNGRYLEIYIEGNFDLAKTVLDSMQISYEGAIKSADNNAPASGICGDAQGDPVNIILGTDASGMPLAGRCMIVNSAQRIKLVNQSVNPVKLRLMEYPITLPVGGELLLDRTVGQYLALGVHFLPMGPELWVETTAAPTFTPLPPPVVTAPPQSVTYDATMADNGKTIVMNIGDKIRINLDYSYGWSTISDFNPAILVGAADGYFAFASGTTTLTMTGNPECLNSTPPCGMPSIMFTITVVVQ